MLFCLFVLSKLVLNFHDDAFFNHANPLNVGLKLISDIRKLFLVLSMLHLVHSGKHVWGTLVLLLILSGDEFLYRVFCYQSDHFLRQLDGLLSYVIFNVLTDLCLFSLWHHRWFFGLFRVSSWGLLWWQRLRSWESLSNKVCFRWWSWVSYFVYSILMVVLK